MALPEDVDICVILDQMVPLLPDAKDAIQTIIEEHRRGSITNWTNIKVVIKEFYRCDSLRTSYHRRSCIIYPCHKNLAKFIFHILKLFDMHKCSDMSVIADILELLWLANVGFIYTFLGACRNFVKLRFNENNDKNPTCMFEKILVLSYKDVPSVVEFNWAEMLADKAKVDVLKTIILYGATPIVPQQIQFDFAKFAPFIHKLMNSHILDINAAISSTLIVENFENFDEFSRRRLYFVNMILMMFINDDFHIKSDDYVQCARIIINSTPEPLITSEEINSVLTKLCSGVVSNGQVLQFLEEYKLHFPESSANPTPRSLKHLSRFQVRESLRTSRSFPYGVKLLGVPEKIQDYIRLKDILL